MVRPLRSLAYLLLVVPALHLTAQTGASATVQSGFQVPLRFEVISIRPHRLTGDEPSNRQMLPGGRFVATATTVRTLIRIASLSDDDHMSGAPRWVDAEAFDIDAITADRAEVKTPEQFQGLILSLLEDRFQFRFHREQKEGPVYRLEVNKPGTLGPGLKTSVPASRPNMSTNHSGPKSVMKVSNMTMGDVAATLRRQTGRPVEDHTGLQGAYDFAIEWSPADASESTLPSLFAVLQEQLGLRLRPARGTVEMVVVDQIDQPSDN